jgi:hypothetical protein
MSVGDNSHDRGNVLERNQKLPSRCLICIVLAPLSTRIGRWGCSEGFGGESARGVGQVGGIAESEVADAAEADEECTWRRRGG